MSFCVECPLCGNSSKNTLLEGWSCIDGGSQIFRCKCGRTVWIETLGWLISNDFISRLKEGIWAQDQTLHRQLTTFLATLMPQELTRALESLDRTTVKLYCSNDKCTEKGFITRTKAMAEKSMHFCSVCNSTMKW